MHRLLIGVRIRFLFFRVCFTKPGAFLLGISCSAILQLLQLFLFDGGDGILRLLHRFLRVPCFGYGKQGARLSQRSAPALALPPPSHDFGAKWTSLKHLLKRGYRLNQTPGNALSSLLCLEPGRH